MTKMILTPSSQLDQESESESDKVNLVIELS
jgi:hypothetical protein